MTDKHHARQLLKVVSSLLLRQGNEPFLDRVITCDEKWILYNNTCRLDADELAKPFPKQELHPKKAIGTVWWTKERVIHYSFLKQPETIKAASYSRELAVCHSQLKARFPALVNRKGPILLHDNAKPHFGKVIGNCRSDRYSTSLRRLNINDQNKEFYSNGIEKLLDRWQKSVDVEGDYFA